MFFFMFFCCAGDDELVHKNWREVESPIEGAQCWMTSAGAHNSTIVCKFE